MSNYKIGSQSVLNGQPVYWAGDDYGWQTQGSFNKLKSDGAFKVGAKQLNRIGSAVKNWYEKNAPQQVKDAATWYGQGEQRANQRLLNRGHSQASIDKANAERERFNSQGGDATQRAIASISNFTNIDQRLVQAGVAITEAVVEGKVGLDSLARRGKSIPLNTKGSVGAARSPLANPINPRVESAPITSRLNAVKAKQAQARSTNKIATGLKPTKLSPEKVAPIQQVSPDYRDPDYSVKRKRHGLREEMLEGRRLDKKVDKPNPNKEWFRSNYRDPDGATTYHQLKQQENLLELGHNGQNLSPKGKKGKLRRIKDRIQRLEEANKTNLGGTPDEVKEIERLQRMAEIDAKDEAKRVRRATTKKNRSERIQKNIQRAQDEGRPVVLDPKADIPQRDKTLPGQDPVYLSRDNQRIKSGEVEYVNPKRLEYAPDLIKDLTREQRRDLSYQLGFSGDITSKEFKEAALNHVYDGNYFDAESLPKRSLTRKELQQQKALRQQKDFITHGKREKTIRHAESHLGDGQYMDHDMLINSELRYRKDRIEGASKRPTSPVTWQKPVDGVDPGRQKFNTKGSKPTRAERAIFKKWWAEVKELGHTDKANPRWNPHKVGNEKAIQNFVNDISDQTNKDILDSGIPRRPIKGDRGRPTNSKLRRRDPDSRVLGSRSSNQVIPDGNSKRSKYPSNGTDMDEYYLYDHPLDSTLSRDPHKVKAEEKLRQSLRRRERTRRYEDELSDLGSDNRYERNHRYADEYGYEDENRLGGGKLKTDNDAGKESARQVFRDARERRGHGDTKHRPRKSDPVRKGVKGKASRIKDAIERVIKVGGTRPTPGKFTTVQPSSLGRTVPTSPTVLDLKKGLKQPKPKSDRVRKLIQKRRNGR